jgi:hypothetical protein
MGIVEFLNQGWVGMAVGVAIAVALYARGRSNRRLAIQGRSRPLATRSSEVSNSDLVITFKGRVVPGLWKTTVVIWNDGNKTLRGSDVADGDSLRIEHEGVALDATVTHTTRKATGFLARVGADQREVVFQFHFLDPGDGAAVDILHTDPAGDGFLCGTLIGVPRGWTNRGRIPITPTENAERGRNKSLLVFPVIFAPLGIVYAVAGLFPELVLRVVPSLGTGDPPRLVPGRVDWTYAICGFLLTFFATRILSRVRAGPPKFLLDAVKVVPIERAKATNAGAGNPAPVVPTAESAITKHPQRTNDV